jgi:hypothetical protein
MPDLSIEYRQWCETNEYWECRMPGGKGNVYTVVWSRGHDGCAYTCTCEAFKFGKGKECKHIAKAKLKHCRWNWQAVAGDGDTTPRTICPKCKRDLKTLKIGV